ncbi:hypothetical protein DL93DRAFT_611740 [Clavulina sp. PMI_390]|nr:hypothetical protein DL93DRAFT_611740 [Clavulina sp. PMI_390]
MRSSSHRALRPKVASSLEAPVSLIFPKTCSKPALAVFSLGNIVDTDRVERERKETEKRERLMAEAEAEEADAEKKMHPAHGGDIEGPVVDANGAPATAAAKKKKKPVGYGPRYCGPFMYLVYGIEFLLGTRRCPPKEAKTGQPPATPAASNNKGSFSSTV